MNSIRWIAWGVIELEKLERMQRRNYIKRIREELKPLGITLQSGGTKSVPWYQITISAAPDRAEKSHASGGADAARVLAIWLLKELGDHERGEDGGLRSAGAEASVSDNEAVLSGR